MTRPYSVDLRERVVRTVEAGLSRRATARRFEVSVSFVVKLMQRWRRRSSVAPDRYGGSKRSPLEGHAESIVALVAETPDLTIEELRVRRAARVAWRERQPALSAEHPRRNLGDDQHGQAPWPGPARPAVGGRRAARPFVDALRGKKNL